MKDKVFNRHKMKGFIRLIMLLLTVCILLYTYQTKSDHEPNENHDKYLVIKDSTRTIKMEHQINGKPHGEVLQYQNGQLELVSNYYYGQLHGKEFHYNNNYLYAIYNYKNGKLNDTTVFISTKKDTTMVETYSENRLNYRAIYQKNEADINEKTLQFFYKNDTIDNLFQKFVASTNKKINLNLSPNFTYTLNVGETQLEGAFSYKFPNKLLLDSIPYQITYLGPNRLSLYQKTQFSNYPFHLDLINSNLY